MGPGSRRVSGELVRAYPSTNVGSEGELIAPGELSRWLLHRLAQLARSPQSVLISGETGTGKTLFAQHLHEHGAAARTLRIMNCAALRDGLLADLLSDLDAAPTTLFLDEVGELSPWGQAVLLRRLQHEHPHTRFIAATHRDLSQMVKHGHFSGELLAKLSGASLTVSPLRARREEVVPLALHFLRIGLRSANLKLISVEPELFELVERHDWPGNVRELRNAMLNALAVNDSGTLEIADLPDAVRAPPAAAKGYSR
ncbi:MAG TPA: sigma 54-interacting transcriptional regulator [Polyangiales bacterium]|nr:sigma 54-interacting transcriptional regulator [Polyangiales bacterium]